MPEAETFYPHRWWGLIVQLALAGALFLVGGYGLLQASLAEISLNFFLFLIPTALAILGLPFLALQVYGLLNASYTLERDGIRLRWGLRYEDIPVDQVLWVRKQTEYRGRLPLPVTFWTGVLLGERRLADGQEVEFLAGRAQQLVLIATKQRMYAISPANVEQFLQAYRRLTELGSLAPILARSVYPAFALLRFWGDRLARWLILSGALLCLGLLAAVITVIPSRTTVVMRFSFSGAAQELAPAVRLMLLPVLNITFYVSDLALGMFLYRRVETRSLAYLLWVTSVITAMLFSGAVILILRAA